MKTLKYSVKKITEIEKEVNIENENFVCVKSVRDGCQFITAFIGKGEGNPEKMIIEVSAYGNYLNIERMAGDADKRAEWLLDDNIRNEVCTNSEFLEILKQNSHYLNNTLKLLK